MEHLKFAITDDLEGIMDKESARKLLKAYSREKQVSSRYLEIR